MRKFYPLVFLVAFLAYLPVAQFDFVNFDDPEYVTGNPHVKNGVTSDGIRWAFTSIEAANWFPLTRLSHMLDVELFGVSGGAHHAVNAFLHALAALFLFAFLNRATGACRPSAFVALVFALHPLHVESVAWVSERKDVLCALFWFLTLWAYSANRYWWALGAFACGLMSKPMIVTLPFLLPLLDVWPLRRRVLATQKAPFFALSGAAAAVTYFVQQGSGAVRTAETFPLDLRFANAVVSYVIYVAKMFWPSGLAAFYPYPVVVPAWQVIGSIFLLAGVTAAVLWRIRAQPYLAVGWFWYLGALVPVIGLVQVGAQARADRYTYVPMTGLLIMIAWGAADVVARWPRAEQAARVLAYAACLILGVLCAAQIQTWKNSETLFRHAIEVTEGNYLAHHNLGVALAESPARLPEAISEYREALRIKPDSARARTDLASALAQSAGGLPEAITQYQEALRVLPDSPVIKGNLALAQYNLGLNLAQSGRMSDAIPHFEAALAAKPDFAEAHNDLGVALAALGKRTDAILHFEAALRIKPDFADAHTNLGVALAEGGNVPEGIAHLRAALKIKPDPEVQQLLVRLQKR